MSQPETGIELAVLDTQIRPLRALEVLNQAAIEYAQIVLVDCDSVKRNERLHMDRGQLIGGVEDERLYWFSEGFTDYYASLLLLRAGLISLEDHVAGYNSLIKEYYASPVRLLTAADMVQKRQTSYEVERLFYQRGAVLAHYWNIAIRSRTNDKSSLDGVMRSLLKSAKTKGVRLSHKGIAHALHPFLGGRGTSDIEKYIDRGELVPADNPFGTCAIAEVNNYHPWDMGFEADTSFKTRVISGVAPDSNAHRAGLRDGQKWVSGGFVHGDPGRLTKLTVIEGDTQKVVQLSRGHRSDPPATVQAEAGYFG